MNNNIKPNFEQIISKKEIDTVYKELKKGNKFKKKIDRIIKKYPLPQSKP